MYPGEVQVYSTPPRREMGPELRDIPPKKGHDFCYENIALFFLDLKMIPTFYNMK